MSLFHQIIVMRNRKESFIVRYEDYAGTEHKNIANEPQYIVEIVQILISKLQNAKMHRKIHTRSCR